MRDALAVANRCITLGGYLATGDEIDSQFCHVFKFKDGKVTSFQQFTDTAQFQKAMGVLAGAV